MTDYPSGSPAAGWYTDPADASHERWWDGAQWSHNTRPLAAPVVAAPAAVGVPGGGVNPFAAVDAQPSYGFPSEQAGNTTLSRGSTDFSDFNSFGSSDYTAGSTASPAPAFGSYGATPAWSGASSRSAYSEPATNGFATAGLILSILGASGLGIVFSILGLRRARQHESAGDLPVGRKRSRWGLALGLISIALGSILFVAWLFFWPQFVGLVMQQQVQTPPGISTPVVIDDGSYDRASYEQEIYAEYEWEELGTPTSVTCPDMGSTAPGSIITCEIVLVDRIDTWTAEYFDDGVYSVSTSSIQN